MTRQEALAYIHEWLKDEYALSSKDREALDMAIKELEQEPCDDAISRQAVLDAMYKLCDTGETLKENPWRDNPHIDAITDEIDNLPSVKPQDPKTGQWVYKNGIRYCEFCGASNSTAYANYCPNCGAKMVEPQESEESEDEHV